MSAGSDNAGAALLDDLDTLIENEPEADLVLRATTTLVVDAIEQVTWIGIYVAEDTSLELGPTAGDENARPEEAPSIDQPPIRELAESSHELATPVVFDGAAVALLVARTSVPQAARHDAPDPAAADTSGATPGDILAPDDMLALLRDVGARISGQCLVGWDTGGVAWEDVS